MVLAISEIPDYLEVAYMDFYKLLNSSEYDFLRTNPRLSARIILLGLGGSYAYGTNNENSDVDFRGVTLNLPSDLIGLTEFEQYEDGRTDTVIYSFNKIIKLLLNCNPNVIEILGLDDDQYFIRTTLGQELLNNRGLFLSKLAARSFGGYADAQLRRLQNAAARDYMPQKEREQHIYRSVQHALDDFKRKNERIAAGRAEIYIAPSDRPEFDTEIFLDVEYKHLPLRDYGNMLGTMNSVVRNYDRIGKRNNKKDDERGEIKTHRIKEHDLLQSIRRGDFKQGDKGFSAEFYKILSDYEKRLEEAMRFSKLPDRPDMEAVARFVERVNRKVVMGDV